MRKSRLEEDVEEFTTDEIKDLAILYVKRMRRTTDKTEKIQAAIIKVYEAVKKRVKFNITLSVIHEIWPDCIASVKEMMERDSHYREDELIADDEDLELFDSLLITDHERNLAQYQEEKKKKLELRQQERGRKKKITTSVKKHRTGMSSELPLKSKKIVKHPKIDTFARRKVQQQEAMVEEFYKLKDEFTKTSNKIADKNDNESVFWSLICEKYRDIASEDYDACTYEVLGELQKIFEE